MGDIQLSVVVLAWDQLPLTMKCVESLRGTTDVRYELIIVDNGSAPDAVAYADAVADVSILNSSNHGFAAGMNQGLAAAEGKFVAFVNNDTEFPAAWASRVLEAFESASVGICVPAVTAAGNPVTVRTEVGAGVVVLDRFAELPSGVVYVMRTDVARDLGGWNEMYPVASAEDLDLAFTVWLNDLEIVLDERVLVQHVSQGTVRAKLPDRTERYRSNLNLFLDRWSGNDPIVRLPACELEIHARNRAAGRAAAVWLRRLIQERDVSSGLRQVSVEGSQPVTKPKKRWFQS